MLGSADGLLSRWLIVPLIRAAALLVNPYSVRASQGRLLIAERSRIMRTRVFILLLSLLPGSALVAQRASSQGKAGQAMGVRYEDLHWQTIVPELGADSPQISILRVDPCGTIAIESWPKSQMRRVILPQWPSRRTASWWLRAITRP